MGFAIARVAARLLARPILQEYDAFKSVAKGLTGGSERIRVGCEDLSLRSGLATLANCRLTGFCSLEQRLRKSGHVHRD